MLIRTVNRFLRFQGKTCNKAYNINIHYNATQVCASQYRGYAVYSSDSFKFNTLRNFNKPLRNRFSNNVDQSNNFVERELDSLEFDKISTETLESLSDYFDELIENSDHLEDADSSYRDGVLTIKFGNEYGTYVINRQAPNKQIWLSSPTSGPKRYDFINGKWIYKHDGKSLHELLNNEISKIVKIKTFFDTCMYSGAS